MYKTFVIIRHSFLEAVLQPIYSLLLALGAGILIVYGMLPFFTLGEDTKMFKLVGLDVILLMVLLSTLFATSKSIYDEIEDRTMLTLMSKPVQRWQVMIGKYLGIILAAAVAVAVLGGILILLVWCRVGGMGPVPNDYFQFPSRSLNDLVQSQLSGLRMMHIVGLLPQLVLTWLQISVLAAIGVALSTRFSLVVNLPTVIILYLAGNLIQFLFPLESGPLSKYPPIVKGAFWLLSLGVPYLNSFDWKNQTLLSTIKVAQFAKDSSAISPAVLWAHVGLGALNALAYSSLALCAGMWSFHTRELGGGEG